MTDLKLYGLNQLSTDLFQPDMSLSKKEKKGLSFNFFLISFFSASELWWSVNMCKDYENGGIHESEHSAAANNARHSIVEW